MQVLLSADTQLVAYPRKVALIRHFLEALGEFIENPSSHGIFGSVAIHYSTVILLNSSYVGILLCDYGSSFRLLKTFPAVRRYKFYPSVSLLTHSQTIYLFS